MVKTIMFLACATTVLATAAADLKKPDKKYVDAANKVYLYRHRYDMKGGAHTNGGAVNGKLVLQAVAAYAGDKSAETPLLKHLRFLMQGPNAISANGGYPAQHEKMFIAAVVIARNTPSVWKQLTAEEKNKLELLVKASLAGCAFTTSDNLYKDKGYKPVAMDGDNNLNRGWNPNFREGMIGGLISGACFLGGKEAQKFLDTYNHETFCEELKKAGLDNTYDIFTWKKTHPDSNAPTAETVNMALHNFRYNGISVAEPMKLYYTLVDNTYSGTVNPGLNNGEGIKGAGKIVAGAENLPNKGKKGMLKEFASRDAKGYRSSITYAYDGFRPNLANQLCLIVSGNFKSSDPEWKKDFELIKVGNDDLFYKFQHGYINYAKGKAYKNVITYTDSHDYEMMKELWYNVVLPYHEAQLKK